MRNHWMALALSVLLLFGAGGTIVTAEESTQAQGSFQGKINVGGYSLYINVQGQRQEGRPTVVFENGNGDTSAIWSQVAPQLAQQTRVVTYDRVGTGQSDAPDRSTVDYTAAGEAERLHTLLANANVNGPLVIVAHSIGGLYARTYQKLYPDQVKGIVFVDSATEHQEQYLFPEFDTAAQEAIMNDDLTNGTGIPVELSLSDYLASSLQLDQIQSTDPLRSLPITVLSGGNHAYPAAFPNLEQYWANRQGYLAGLSDNAVHTVDPVHGHYLHTQNPQLVISAINAMLQRTEC
ncbi:alpha/beta fold hydrolase [Paenibacillus gansuensis]|uniref:Alpha/beta fold hydrolase n=1 Tax=Paenibacillus gansuensis TaxID=306542 RepID=A0ABW5PJ95_9BACL